MIGIPNPARGSQHLQARRARPAQARLDRSQIHRRGPIRIYRQGNVRGFHANDPVTLDLESNDLGFANSWISTVSG